jgi:glycerol-3-phosphate cytidylyltransferase-like family protein
MSGAAGGSRIKKEDLKATIRDYRDNVLKPLGLDKSYTITGVRSRPEKEIFGDIDIVISFPEGNKKELKQTLASFIEQVNKIPEIPQKKNKKYFIHGSIVSILYPIYGKENEYVQIDNIVAASKEEGKFIYKILDLPAQEQGLALGLVKAVFSELDQNQIDELFKDLDLSNIEKPGEDEEYDFNLNPSELSLKIVKKGTSDGKTIWTSNKFSDIKTVLSALGIDIEKDKFDTIISKIKKFKNRRSIDRLKGMYTRNIRVGDAEVGLEKGIKKQQSIDVVNALQEKYNALVMKMITPLLMEEKKSSIAVFPGKFKPPHKDHLARINAAANAADEVLVIIGPKSVDSFTAEKTLDLFNLFKLKGLVPNNVKFMISDLPSPVLKAYKEFEDNPNQQYVGVFGKDDIARFKGISKLPNVKIDSFEKANVGNLSATDLRKAIVNKDIPTIQSMIPDGIDVEDYMRTLTGEKKLQEIITDTEVICDNCDWHWSIEDGGKDLYVCHKCGHDNASKSNKAWNLQNGIVSLTKYMLDNGMNISPLPKLKFIDNDKENADGLLGKTAYYNPLEKSITLYTLNRHPKDILRSYAHEMVHHVQNLENRLNNINTTNTNEDGALPEIEKEAYEKGNMMLRNWEDDIKNK